MSETVAIIKVDGESGWLALNLQDAVHARHFLEEVRGLIEGSFLPDHVDEDDDPPFVTVEIRQKPDGWVAALPEFTGW